MNATRIGYAGVLGVAAKADLVLVGDVTVGTVVPPQTEEAMNALQQPVAVASHEPIPLVVLHHVRHDAPPAPGERVATLMTPVLRKQSVVETGSTLRETVESGIHGVGPHAPGEGVLTACWNGSEGAVEEDGACVLAVENSVDELVHGAVAADEENGIEGAGVEVDSQILGVASTPDLGRGAATRSWSPGR